MSTILVLGAGTGGVVTARELWKNIGYTHASINIIVFEKEQKSVFSPSLPWLMVGKRKPEQVYENIDLLKISGIDVVKGEIENIDPQNITVTANGNVYKGDFMVISLGVEQEDPLNLGRYGHNFFTLEGATNFQRDLKKFIKGTVAVVITSLPFKSPAAPYEAAMLIEDHLKKEELNFQARVALFTPENGPMDFAGKNLSQEIQTILKQKGIAYYPNHQLVGVEENLLKFSNGKNYEFDLLAFTPQHLSPKVIRQSGLAGEDEWISVNSKTLETAFQNVYAIGDVTEIRLKNGLPLPKIGIFAQQQAKVVARIIAEKLGRDIPSKPFTAEGKYYIEFGDGLASTTEVNFYDSSGPEVNMNHPEQWGHWSKWWDEKYWFFKNF